VTTWAFQSNPKLFDVVDATRHRIHSDWAANQHRNRIAIGDRVYFYVSGAKAGIYVVGTVVAGLVKRPAADAYGEWKVGVRYDARVTPPLLRAELLADPTLGQVSLFTRWQGTNYPLEPKAARRIKGLTQGRLERTWRGESVTRADRVWRLYVLELGDDAGPGRLPHRPNVYVGETSRTVLERLGVHLTDRVKGSGKVRRHFRAIRFDLFDSSRTYRSKEDALKAEANLAERLGRRGYTVINETGEDLRLLSLEEI
jgi:hypothetical protein